MTNYVPFLNSNQVAVVNASLNASKNNPIITESINNASHIASKINMSGIKH